VAFFARVVGHRVGFRTFSVRYKVVAASPGRTALQRAMDFHSAAADAALLLRATAPSSLSHPPPPPLRKRDRRYEYPDAMGCSDELDAWCTKWCPQNKSLGELVARRIVPTGFSPKRGPKGSLKWWGCFPKARLDRSDETTLLLQSGERAPPGAAAALKFCGAHSRKEKRFFMTREQRMLTRTFRACHDVLEANRQLPGVSAREQARTLADAFIAQRSNVSNLPTAIAQSIFAHSGGLARRPATTALDRCTDGSAYVSVLVGAKWVLRRHAQRPACQNCRTASSSPSRASSRALHTAPTHNAYAQRLHTGALSAD
jgi:hypothetical protein